MSLLVPNNFRDASVHEACIGLTLTDEEADDVTLAASILRLTTRISRWCNDTFEPTTGALSVYGTGTNRLLLPFRYTAVSSVKTRDAFGTLGGAVTATAYRLQSSLNAAGSDRISTGADQDWLEIVYGGTGVPSTSASAFVWPYGAAAVEVTGTYGWTLAPPEIKRALALLTYDHVKRKRGDLRDAESMQAGGTLVRFVQPDPQQGIYSGIGEADEIIRDYDRHIRVAIA